MDGWRDVLDVNLTGTYNTVEVAVPTLVEQGDGGAIVLISSVAGLIGMVSHDPGALGYTAAKHGIVGLMRADTRNTACRAQHSSELSAPDRCQHADDQQRVRPEQWLGRMADTLRRRWATLLPVPVLQPEDIANAVACLVSDAARYVTGVTLPVDAGSVNKH